MTRSTHAECIISLLVQTPGLNDDEIAQALAIKPRQTVNQVCRRLANHGVLWRERGPGGKIINRLRNGSTAPAAHPREVTPKPKTERRYATTGVPPGRSLTPASWAKTLLVIPCSKAKQDRTGIGEGGATITDSLPTDLAQELLEARQHVKERIRIDETTLVPAMRRYAGSLYQAAGDALYDLAQAGCHIIILSGGYGAVLASEPIGLYNQILKTSWWPHHILERVLIAHAQRVGLSSVRAFCSATSAYRTVLQRVRWRNAGIEDALLLMPQAKRGGTRKSPASQGEAVDALRDGTLTTSWHSSYGLSLDIHSG